MAEIIDEKTYYRYRLLTVAGPIPIMSDVADKTELWKQIVKAKEDGLEFFYLDAARQKFYINIRPSAVIALDNYFGTAPVVQNPGKPQDRRRHGRPNRIVIGQQAKKVKK